MKAILGGPTVLSNTIKEQQLLTMLGTAYFVTRDKDNYKLTSAT